VPTFLRLRRVLLRAKAHNLLVAACQDAGKTLKDIRERLHCERRHPALSAIGRSRTEPNWRQAIFEAATSGYSHDADPPALRTVNHLWTIKPAAYILGLVGIGLFTVLLIREGVGQVGMAIGRVGWGLLALAFYHLLQTLSDAAGWLALFPRESRISLVKSFLVQWLGESINNLLPMGRVGGDIIITRIVAMWGAPLKIAVAAMIVDVTIGVAVKVILILAGCVLLVATTGRHDLIQPALVTVVAGTLAALGFYAVQRIGMFRWSALLASRISKSPEWSALVESGESVDKSISLIYARLSGVAGCFFFWVLSWLLASGEIWLALLALGVKSSFTMAIILESAAQTIRAVAFLVPGAFGVQEGGYILLGSLLGIPGQIALALSLIRRVRELALGIPGLIGWQVVEALRLTRAKAR
jgi:putative membrane protein